MSKQWILEYVYADKPSIYYAFYRKSAAEQYNRTHNLDNIKYKIYHAKSLLN